MITKRPVFKLKAFIEIYDTEGVHLGDVERNEFDVTLLEFSNHHELLGFLKKHCKRFLEPVIETEEFLNALREKFGTALPLVQLSDDDKRFELIAELKKEFPTILGIQLSEAVDLGEEEIFMGNAANGALVDGLPACCHECEIPGLYIDGVQPRLYEFLKLRGWCVYFNEQYTCLARKIK